MIFTKLTLENYGLFEGRHEFDLRPRTKYSKVRPIVLFGGKNGAGKTTFLDAIRLILYGRRALGDRLTQKEFEDALAAKLHRRKHENAKAPYAKLALDFEHVVVGEKHEYRVERSWMTVRGSKIEHYFKVERSGKPLDEVSAEHWESFIADIVPERLSQLFFFDGEKIKTIADDISGNAAISESIQTLLGLDTVQALKSDLATFKVRLLKEADPDAYGQEMSKKEQEVSAITAEIAQIDDELASVRTKLDGHVCSLANIETRLREKGGLYADHRGTNQKKVADLRESIRTLESDIRAGCEGPLPFALCPKVRATLVAQFRRDGAVMKDQARLAEIEQLKTHLLNRAKKSASLRDPVSRFLEEEFNAYTESNLTKQHDRIIHFQSESAVRHIEEIVEVAAPEQAAQMTKLLNELEKSMRQLLVAEKEVERAPDSDELKELTDSIAQRNQEIGALRHQEEHLQERRTQAEHRRTLALRETEKMAERIRLNQAQSQKLELIKRIGPGLDIYRQRLTKAKIELLESEITACFNRLARKADFVRSIRINPETFAVSVLDQQGRAVPKEDLSSGEKQIFAIAMLWGLARTSGRPLPVVIDTPLGRLDSEHRAKLVENYFPNAGHQVILLSTDTEVDQGLFSELSPAISHCYHLQYNHEQGRTTAVEEYFWREK